MRNLIAWLLAALCICLPATASEVSTWSTTSDNNNSAPPNGWPEGMQYSQVNNSAREMMGSIARWRDAFTVPVASVSGAAGSSRYYLLKTGANARWGLLAGGAPESGGNAGSNFSLVSYNDAGSLLATIYSVDRASGMLTFGQTPAMPTAGTADNSTKGATTAWVRTYASSGTYTPTITANANAFTSSPYGVWSRVGNIVQASVYVQTTTTGAGVGCGFEISLPVGSNITVAGQVIGTGYSINSLVADYAAVNGAIANPGRVKVSWLSSAAAAGYANITFSYEVH